ncbi:hypothetical protein MGU_03699 [Metarhizium guizhouense ARSEF 977]|uniref:Uncharacterized protein n=1 Tax=Metarhizium guizhouense (strain ARSEF 977) TaxID=1276136 RepID=A0A0B4I7D4_METGA|nr:hypothetical protein MGU_03699 [Metarhizium guizhouense ARSEF 977]
MPGSHKALPVCVGVRVNGGSGGCGSQALGRIRLAGVVVPVTPAGGLEVQRAVVVLVDVPEQQVSQFVFVVGQQQRQCRRRRARRAQDGWRRGRETVGSAPVYMEGRDLSAKPCFFPFYCSSSLNSWGRSRNGEYGKMLLEEKGVGGERGVDRDVRCAGEAFGLGNA